jgi:hypothetical protein
MTSHVVRLYTLAVAVVVLFLAWAVIAAHPWKVQSRPAADPRVHALALREQRIRRETVVVRRIVARRWRRYHVALRHRKQQIATVQKHHQQALAAAATAPSAPSVQVVTLPPLTVTRTS